jgi:hypothetical protein
LQKGKVSIDDADFTKIMGADYKFAKESKQAGYVIVVRIDYYLGGYTLTITHAKGTLTRY